MRVGQTLQIKNDDPLLHNVHNHVRPRQRLQRRAGHRRRRFGSFGPSRRRSCSGSVVMFTAG
jgi:hypothetical protein